MNFSDNTERAVLFPLSAAVTGLHWPIVAHLLRLPHRRWVAGLGYMCKESGSPFKNTGSMATISCYKCGQHKHRFMGIFKKIINQQMFMCGKFVRAKSA
jgi:hypothetical protein